MRLFALALLSSLLLTVCSRGPSLHPLPPITKQRSDEAKPPLFFGITLASDIDDLKAVQDWLPPGSHLSAIYVLVQIVNRSDKVVVLPGFAYYDPGFQFYCSSPDAKHPPFFRTIDGQIKWVVLRPHQSINAYDDVAESIAFLRQGHYTVNYQLAVGYTYADDSVSSTDNLDLSDRFHRDHIAVTSGTLDVPIGSEQVFNEKAKP